MGFALGTPARGAYALLQYNPLIGRSVSANTRQLVIGRRGRGYVACTGTSSSSTRSSCLQFAVSGRLATAEIDSVESAHRDVTNAPAPSAAAVPASGVENFSPMS